MVSQVLLCLAQKKVLDTTAIAKWQSVDGGKISGNGNWVSYQVITGNHAQFNTIIKSLSGRNEIELPGSVDISFTTDSRYAVFKEGNKLNILKLGEQSPKSISDVNSFDLLHTGSGDFILYTKSGRSNDLYSIASDNGSEKTYHEVINYRILGQSLLITFKKSDDSYELQQIYPERSKSKLIYAGMSVPENISSSNDGTKILFKSQNKLWLFNEAENPKPVQLHLFSKFCT